MPPTPWELSHRQELSSKTERLKGTRAAGRRMKANLEKLVQRRTLPLPSEIMGIIFDFYVHHCRQLPETLLLVCRIWHVLALSQRTLWTNLDPLGQFDRTAVRPWAGTFLQSRIARSNPVPLKVDFTSFSWKISPSEVQKIASIPTFRRRIQELVINHEVENDFLVGPQPLLNSLTARYQYPLMPLEKVFASPTKFMLAEKKITTLRLHTPSKPPVWPDSSLQRLHTLEVNLTNWPGDIHKYWTLIQNSTNLCSIHIVPCGGTAPALPHPSVQHLSILYPECWDVNRVYCLGEVRMPCLQGLIIDTSAPQTAYAIEADWSPIVVIAANMHTS